MSVTSLPFSPFTPSAEQAAVGGSDVQNARTLRGAALCPLPAIHTSRPSDPANLCSLSFQQQEPSRKACHRHTQMTHLYIASISLNMYNVYPL